MGDIAKINLQQKELASYFAKMLRDTFGKGPKSIHVTIYNSIIIVYLKEFISPIERVLLEQKQDLTVIKTREILIHTLLPKIKVYINLVTGMEVEKFYYDWNLETKSGIFVGTAPGFQSVDQSFHAAYEGQEQLHREIMKISERVQKEPDEIFSFRLNSRAIVVIRNGILVAIEKELIELGYENVLKLAKGNLVKRLLHGNSHFESILSVKLVDIFIDWDFASDNSVIVFITEPAT